MRGRHALRRLLLPLTRRAKRRADLSPQAGRGKAPTLLRKPLALVGFHHAAGVVVAGVVGIGEEIADMVAAAHVAELRLREVARQQAERERMAAESPRRCPQFLVGPPDAIVAQQRRAGFVRQLLHVEDRGGAGLPPRNVLDRQPAGEDHEPVAFGRRHRREPPQQGAQSRLLQFALLGPEAMLQRLGAVEHEQHAARRQGLRDRLALRASRWWFRF